MNNDSSKLKYEEYNATQMFNIAKTFLAIANQCNEPPIEKTGWMHHSIIPMVTNIVLSCELLLKTLLKINNIKQQHHHDLFKLFEALPMEIQKDIICADDSKEFVGNLKKNSRLFEKWRYLYEYTPQSVNIIFLFDFAGRLSTYIDQQI